MTDPDPYNPLARENLGRSVEHALLQRAALPLKQLSRFRGAGIYVLYYAGPFPLYGPISSTACRVPIYVGKADVPGSRRGLLSAASLGDSLWRRLRQHADSIEASVNLALDDFYCRHLVVDDIWIPLGESLMIGNFRPVWNGVVDGFGLHEPGRRRHGGLRSEWDELHPGRPWHAKMLPRSDAESIAIRVANHFKQNPPPPTQEVPTD